MENAPVSSFIFVAVTFFALLPSSVSFYSLFPPQKQPDTEWVKGVAARRGGRRWVKGGGLGLEEKGDGVGAKAAAAAATKLVWLWLCQKEKTARARD